MAQATNPKIEELRFRLKSDPRSRLFYQLAEELRKGGQAAEAEQVLRSGLSVYPTYLAAWVSLGRALRERKDDRGAIEALSKAMQLDPGNVVAARLLADAYRSLGENVEAIKKYKLVLALMPGDEELKSSIEQIERELHPPQPATVSEPAQLETGGGVEFAPATESAAFVGSTAPVEAEPLFPEQPQEPEALTGGYEESPFDKTIPPFEEDVETGDAEPMFAAHEESPFEEPVDAATVAAFELEQPAGMHIVAAPLVAEMAAPPAPLEEEADVFAPVASEAPQEPAEVTNTLTMGELYERQGLVHEAQHIYENVLAREPDNAEARAKLDALAPRVNPKIARLERWLSRISRKEVGSV